MQSEKTGYDDKFITVGFDDASLRGPNTYHGHTGTSAARICLHVSFLGTGATLVTISQRYVIIIDSPKAIVVKVDATTP